jgi:para-aminobenzoate synthetase component 1
MITFGQWTDWNESYNCLPYIESYEFTEPTIRSWERLWAEAGDAAIVLESGKAGRYSFVGADPAEWVSGGLTEAVRRKATGGDAGGERIVGPPLRVLREWMSEYASPPIPRAPKFTGGIVGYLAYDAIRTIERLPELAAADSPVPDYFFLRLEKLWIIDHADQRLYCVRYIVRAKGERWDEARLRERFEEARSGVADMKRAWDRWAGADEPSLEIPETLDIEVEHMPDVRFSLPKPQYMDAVERIRDYIASGDVFQVNISVRQSKPLRAAPERVYEALRRLNPSPYMAFLRLPGGERIVSGSPELLVRLEHGRLSTRPIAGTRPRGKNDGEDVELRDELLLSEKERAEHIMLVDLERNDLGRISTFGTVRVKELMAVEQYSHVMHIVSEVEGELAEGKDAFDCIAAVFPGGTITGAPKIRTMEIIEELEPVRRGVYTGAIGWIDYNGNMELNITIRTLVYADSTAHVQSGAGIVIDSDPEKEFVESLNKAKALWKAVEISERA